MPISLNNPIGQTWIFTIILLVGLFIFVKPREIKEWFPAEVTTELKGLAILMIVLSHIGYFLVTDHRFLWPLSIMAGVGVNLFLFLSGFGLSVSQLRKKLSVGQFYKKRLLKLFQPFWLVLAIFLIIDLVFLKITYSWGFIGKAVIGIFTHADLYQDLNSPLWYLTFILGYYLLFPLVFSRKYPWLTAIILYLVGYLVIYFQPTRLDYVLHLYKVHIFAFPLGVLAAGLLGRLKGPEILEKFGRGMRILVYYLIPLVFLGIFVYANINSGIGEPTGGNKLQSILLNKEQLMSTLAVLAICLVFALKKIEFRLFYWFGLYSYEIYLLHWPIMYRYDIFYSWLPAWLATILYLGLFIGLSCLVKKITTLKLRPSSKLIKTPVK
jgi:peptidoglycan/LPS O-acetylase OafA/YrhL